MIRMKKFEVEIEKVNGYCPYSYKNGDPFHNNPDVVPDSISAGFPP
jgi:hypothetical protein